MICSKGTKFLQRSIGRRDYSQLKRTGGSKYTSFELPLTLSTTGLPMAAAWLLPPSDHRELFLNKNAGTLLLEISWTITERRVAGFLSQDL